MCAAIGIIGAMEVEVATLISLLDHDRTTTASGMVFHEGRLNGVDVVIVRCGVGKVNAAMCAQALIDRFDVSQVINTGVAGALDDTLDVGDLVVSVDAVYHDMDVTGLGYQPCYVPEMGEPTTGLLAFVASEELRAILVKAARAAVPGITVREGRIASGDQFICTQEARDFIISASGAHCCEMEGAAIAHVCVRNQVPFVIVRTISDRADDSSTTEYRISERETAERCAAIVARAMELLG